MRRIVFSAAFLVILSGFLTCFAPIAGAQNGNDPYIIHDVEVDILAESAVKARNKAFGEAQAKAFKLLAARFVSNEDLEKLPVPDAQKLSGLVKDFEISKEQLSNKRYRGTYEFRFREGAVRAHFGHGPVYFAEEKTEEPYRILLLPYYQDIKKTVLLKKEFNPFLVELESVLPQTTQNKRIEFPQGGISDETDIGSSDPHMMPYSVVKRLKARYDVDEVVIALAQFNGKQKPFPLTIEIYRTDRGRVEIISSHTVEMEIETESQIPDLFKKAAIMTLSNVDAGWNNVTSSVQTQEGDQGQIDPDATHRRLAEEERQYTNAEPTRDAIKGEAEVKVFFTNIGEWLDVRRALNNVPGLDALRIETLKTNEVNMKLIYTDFAAMTSALGQRGISLEQSSAGFYVLKRVPGNY